MFLLFYLIHYLINICTYDKFCFVYDKFLSSLSVFNLFAGFLILLPVYNFKILNNFLNFHDIEQVNRVKKKRPLLKEVE